jgi:hypothetical protein
MITAIRVVSPTGMTLSVCGRTKSGKFRSGDGSVTLLELLHNLRASRVQGRLELAAALDEDGHPCALQEDIFDLSPLDPAIRPEAARHLVGEFSLGELARAALIMAIREASASLPQTYDHYTDPHVQPAAAAE